MADLLPERVVVTLTPSALMFIGPTFILIRHGEDTNMTATNGFVVPAGGGKHLDMTAPGRFAALKLVGHETNESIMLFEETVPVGTKSLFHLHRDSDEV